MITLFPGENTKSRPLASLCDVSLFVPSVDKKSETTVLGFQTLNKKLEIFRKSFRANFSLKDRRARRKRDAYGEYYYS